MKRLILILFAVIFTASAIAQESRSDLLKQIAKHKGVSGHFALQRIVERDLANKLFNIMHPPITEDSKRRLQMMDVQAARERFLRASEDLFSSDELFDKWSDFFGKDFSNEELLQIIQYYESPVGKKDALKSQSSPIELHRWLEQERKNRIFPHLQKMLEEVKKAER
jgi:hypothetical protein